MMKKTAWLIVFLSFYFTVDMAFISRATAETGYVSDMLILTMRDGPGKSYSVLNTLRSNTAIEILETKDKYYRVRTPDGEVGWVSSQYITFDIPLTVTIERLEKKIAALEKENQRITQEHAPIQKSMETRQKKNAAVIKELKLTLKKESKENLRVAKEFDLARKNYEQLKKDSQNTIEILNENKRFKQKLAAFQSEIDTLKAENKSAFKAGMIKWFLGGAGVLFLGWIIGRSFSGSKRKSGSLLN